MTKRRRLRKVVTPSGFKGYIPYGLNHSKNGFIEFLLYWYFPRQALMHRFTEPQKERKTNFKNSLSQVSPILPDIKTVI